MKFAVVILCILASINYGCTNKAKKKDSTSDTTASSTPSPNQEEENNSPQKFEIKAHLNSEYVGEHVYIMIPAYTFMSDATATVTTSSQNPHGDSQDLLEYVSLKVLDYKENLNSSFLIEFSYLVENVINLNSVYLVIYLLSSDGMSVISHHVLTADDISIMEDDNKFVIAIELDHLPIGVGVYSGDTTSPFQDDDPDEDIELPNTAQIGSSQITDTGLDLVWDAVSGSDQYRVVIKKNVLPDEGCGGTNDISYDTVLTSYNVENLDPDTSYYIRICTLIDGEYSSGGTIIISTLPSQGPPEVVDTKFGLLVRSGPTLYYVYGKEDGAWNFIDVEASAAVGIYADFVVDSQDDIHILYAGPANTTYYHKSVNGIFDASTSIGSYSAISHMGITQANGHIHAYWADTDLVTSDNSGGSFSIASVIYDATQEIYQIKVDAYYTGRIHVVYVNRDTSKVNYRTSDDNYASVEVLDHNENGTHSCASTYVELSLDVLGNPHVVYDCSNSKVIYSNKVEGSWNKQMLIVNEPYSSKIAVGSNGYAHVHYQDNMGRLVYRNNSGGSFGDDEYLDEPSPGSGTLNQAHIAITEDNIPVAFFVFHDGMTDDRIIYMRARTGEDVWTNPSEIFFGGIDGASILKVRSIPEY